MFLGSPLLMNQRNAWEWTSLGTTTYTRSQCGNDFNSTDIYRFGGVDETGTRKNDFLVFNMDTNTETLIASSLTALNFNTGAILGDYFYSIHGYNGVSVYDNVSRLYLPTLTPDATIWDHLSYSAYGSASSVSGSNIYVSGGATAASSELANFVQYDPVAKTSTPLTSMTYARYHHVQVTVGTDIYVIGGFRASASTNLVEKYSGGSWSTMANLPDTIHSAEGFTDGTDIYILGGYSTTLGSEVTTIYKYTVATNTWSLVGNLPEFRRYSNLGLRYDDLVVMVNGQNGGTYLSDAIKAYSK